LGWKWMKSLKKVDEKVDESIQKIDECSWKIGWKSMKKSMKVDEKKV